MRRLALLLRGVNVGGSTVLRMEALRGLLSQSGFEQVRTLGTSGNAVVSSPVAAAAAEALIERASRERLGRELVVLAREAGDLDAVIAAHSFAQAVAERPQHLAVLFGREGVAPDLLSQLRRAYTGPERLEAIGRDIVIDYPDGIGRSKLDGAMRKLPFQAAATARNWNTVLKIRATLD